VPSFRQLSWYVAVQFLGVRPCLAQAIIAGLSLPRPRLAPGSVHVGFVANKVATGQGFLRVVRFFLSVSCHGCYTRSLGGWTIGQLEGGLRDRSTFGSPIWLQIDLARKRILNLALHNLSGIYTTGALSEETAQYFRQRFKKKVCSIYTRQKIRNRDLLFTL
jgi:hypothetical protein